MAGLAYALLYRHTGKLWTAVIAHAVTNGALGLWVVANRGSVVTWALPPKAPHCKAAALDFCVFLRGIAAWNRPELFDGAGALAEEVGLEWGGRWSHPDRPHLQLADWAGYPEV